MKLIGKSDSATRTAEQTAIARLWAGIATTGTGTATNFLSIWNNIARDVARERRLSLVETARVFVLVNVSVHDGLQTDADEQVRLRAVASGDGDPSGATRDLNPATDPDPTWLPLLTDAAVSVVRRQHGDDRRERRARARSSRSAPTTFR